MIRIRPSMRLTALLATAAAVTVARTALGASNPAQDAIDRGLAYLKAHRSSDGSWGTAADPPAISALVLKAFVESPGTVDQATIDRGFAGLLALQKPDGGIYRDALANYNTAICVTALAAVPGGKYRPQVDRAVAYLHTLQWTDAIDQAPTAERKPVSKTDPRYGGFGYGNAKQHPTGRPDGSNMQMALDALHDAGVSPDDPAYKAAVAFASRLQNRSESNDQPWAGNDGGFIYTDAENGSSNGGDYVGPDGKKMFRSYGSMTYAGLKSMIYAGLTHDDPRVKAAWGWVTRNWTWDEVPGLKRPPGTKPDEGLFYYFLTASRALTAYGEPVVTDAQGGRHDWRVELSAKLVSLQQPDGSWVGEKRWMENNPTLATAIAVLCLEQAKADQKIHPGHT